MNLNQKDMKPTVFVSKHLLAVLLIMLALFVSACGNASQSSAGGTKTQPKITLVLPLTGVDLARVIQIGAQAAADETGAKLTVVGPPGLNPVAEAKMLEDATKTHPDGIVFYPFPEDFFARQIKDAASAKVTVAAIDNEMSNYATIPFYVGLDNRESGRVVANAVVDKLIQKLGPDPHGSVVITQCIPGLQTMALTAASEKDVYVKRLPHVQVIGPLITDVEPTKNFAAWQGIMQAHPNALAYSGQCDQDGPNLIKLKTQMRGTFEITSWNVPPETLQAIKAGSMLTSVSGAFFLEGYVPTRLLAEAAKNGKPLPHGWYNPHPQLITSSNVDAFMHREASNANFKGFYQQQIDQFFSDPQKSMQPFSDLPSLTS